jgi:hypothetical protein
MSIRFPWDDSPRASDAPRLTQPEPEPRRRGRRPAAPRNALSSPVWIYHHLTITGSPDTVARFAAAARGPGIIPWRLDLDRIEEDVFHLAAAQPAEQRLLTIAGCRILAGQFREKVETRQARAAALMRTSRACPLDLQVLLPVPQEVLALGPTDPNATGWLMQHWGIDDLPRKVIEREALGTDDQAAAQGYGFFTADTSPTAAVDALTRRWPGLSFDLQPRTPA